MTIEHKFIVGLEEIKAIVFECVECKARIVLTPENVGNTPPNKCPRGHSWEWSMTDEHRNVDGSSHVFFFRSLKNLRDAARSETFRILLEFDEPKN
jgi:hypothetical protein